MNATDDPTIEQHQEARNDLHGGPALAHVADTIRRMLPPDPLTMIQTAIEKGLDPEAMRTLCELQRQWQADRAVAAYNDALATVQAELPPIVKNADNQGTGKKYEDLEAVNRVIVPVITKHGFAVSYGTEDSKLDGHIRIVAEVTHRAGHSKRHALDIPLDGEGAKGGKSAMNKTQATGSTISYGRRYLARMIFNLTTTDDNDGQGTDPLCNDEQSALLRALLDEALEIGAVKEGGKRFYKWLEVETLDALPLRKLDLAIAELNRAIALKKKEALP